MNQNAAIGYIEYILISLLQVVQLEATYDIQEQTSIKD